MKSAQDFEDVKNSLWNQINREIVELKKSLLYFDESASHKNAEQTNKVISDILYAADGLKNLISVLSYIDCWDENDEPPQMYFRKDHA